MKLESNWKDKSLENLEKVCWEESATESHLIKTCFFLRKKPLIEFETEDIRIMIGQNIGLKYLIPLAIERLKVNILTEGDLYQGDLLKSVLKSDVEFWKGNQEQIKNLEEIVTKNMNLLQEKSPELLIDFRTFKGFI